ncbi:MAG: dCTP deaminase [Chloroflexi bacterium]|nr:dCTP deaminase [Chloroflexota bacterium]
MILSDGDIKRAVREGRLTIEPFTERMVQPVSVDLTLGSKLRVFQKSGHPTIDVRVNQPDLTEPVEIDPVTPFYLHPSDFVLGITRERIGLPPELMGRLDGKSSLGRLGLLVHSTAGFIDPGFIGRIVLEFSNVSPLPITLYAGMPIAQISFYQLSRPTSKPYGHQSLGSKYQDQDEPTPSRYYLNFDGRRTSPGSAPPRQYAKEPTPLSQWLKRSRYGGRVRQFARDMGIPLKTVQDWVYGRRKPGPKHAAKVFEVTGLRQFASEQAELFDEAHD